jgi:hypothetical protein
VITPGRYERQQSGRRLLIKNEAHLETIRIRLTSVDMYIPEMHGDG